MSSIGLTLLVLVPLLQVWLLGALLRMRVPARFRWFFIYTVFSILAQIAEFAVRNDPWKYYYLYWIAAAFYAILGFFAIQEAFHQVFEQFYVFLWWFKFLLPGVGIAMLIIALVEGYFNPPIQARPWLATIFVGEIAVGCLQVGIFALFVLLAWLYPMPWRNYAFGISTGFSVAGFGLFLSFMARSVFGTKVISIAQYGPAVAYLIAVVVWLASFIKPEPPDPYEGLVSPLTPEQLLEVLRSYTRQMKDMFRRCLAPSS